MTPNDKKMWRAIIIIAIVVGVFTWLIVWVGGGHAPCSWYKFSMNTSEVRMIMETCSK